MASKIRRIDFSATEWLEGTAELDNATRGLYITACALMWARGGPITHELLRAASRDHGHAFKRQFDILVNLGKLTVNNGQIVNKRALNELKNAEERSTKASQNGVKGNEIKRLRVATRPLDLDANHQPSTINHQEREGSVAKEATAADAAPAPPALAVVAGVEHRPKGVPASVPHASPPDPKKELYARGKHVLGKSAGGQITKLITLHEGDLTAAKYTLEQAADAAFPDEYLGKILSGERNAPMDHDAFYRSQGLSEDEYRAVH